MGMNLILLITGAVLAGVLVSIIVALVSRNAREKDPEARYRGQLDAILNGSEEYEGEYDDDEYTRSRFNVVSKWNEAWGKGLQEISGQFSPEDSRAGMLMSAVWIALTAIVTVFFKNILAGAVIASAVLGFIYLLLKVKAARKDDMIRHQLTGFLFSLKANISANETPERAFLKIIDSMPSPLVDELLVAKNQILSNVGFREAMATLREETSSEDLRFLCSCMIQADSTGVSLEEQIDTIIDAVEQKKRITEEIAQATKAANLSMYAAGVIIPAGFIGVYILDQNARDYWFVDPMSWAMLAIVAVLAFFGVNRARKYVAKVREL